MHDAKTTLFLYIMEFIGDLSTGNDNVPLPLHVVLIVAQSGYIRGDTNITSDNYGENDGTIQRKLEFFQHIAGLV